MKIDYSKLEKKINPLPDGLFWLRGMDTKPKLMQESEVMADIIKL